MGPCPETPSIHPIDSPAALITAHCAVQRSVAVTGLWRNSKSAMQGKGHDGNLWWDLCRPVAPGQRVCVGAASHRPGHSMLCKAADRQVWNPALSYEAARYLTLQLLTSQAVLGATGHIKQWRFVSKAGADEKTTAHAIHVSTCTALLWDTACALQVARCHWPPHWRQALFSRLSQAPARWMRCCTATATQATPLAALLLWQHWTSCPAQWTPCTALLRGEWLRLLIAQEKSLWLSGLIQASPHWPPSTHAKLGAPYVGIRSGAGDAQVQQGLQPVLWAAAGALGCWPSGTAVSTSQDWSCHCSRWGLLLLKLWYIWVCLSCTPVQVMHGRMPSAWEGKRLLLWGFDLCIALWSD